MTPEQYINLTESVTRLKSDYDRTEGAKNQLNLRLKKEFNCSSLKDAKQVYNQRQIKLEELELQFKESFDEFEAGQISEES